MVSSSQSSTLLSSSSVSTPERQKQMSAIFSKFKLRKVEEDEPRLRDPTSSELEADALLFSIGLLCLLSVATVVLHHGPALVHQLLLKHTHTHTQYIQLHG